MVDVSWDRLIGTGAPVFAGAPMLTEGNVCANVCRLGLTLMHPGARMLFEDLSDGRQTMLA